MYPRILAAVIVAGAAAYGSVNAVAAPFAQPIASIPQAPIGHLQPRAQQFSPYSPAEEVEQDRMSTFDVEQHKLDLQLDKKLNICRC